ncbi:MAG: excinuclease ABC subunit UvrA [Candidatus Sumerlaeota bacterium]|nr:excinuclease ABC subunit UvrA [Candidatus Sumerlaeota bacterium]
MRKYSTRKSNQTRKKDTHRAIVVRGARTHNLKNIDIEIPLDQLTVITGPSGSGKSSLAFDTLFAEGQRRFVESMSTYARQFIQQMPRPEVDAIECILPSIALEQKNSVKNARSTVGTATEIRDYLGLIFGRIGRIFCPQCDKEAVAYAPESAADWLARLPEGIRLMVAAPVEVEETRRGGDAETRREGDAETRRGKTRRKPAASPCQSVSVRVGPCEPPGNESEEATETQNTVLGALVRDLMKQGWQRLWLNGQLAELDEINPEQLAHANILHVVTDRVVLGAGAMERLTVALEAAFALGNGRAEVITPEGDVYRFSNDLVCPGCGRRFDPPQPAQFSFYSPLGACQKCQGFGRIISIDMDKVIPNHDLSMNEGAVHPWNTFMNAGMYDWFREVLKREPFPWDRPFRKLSKKHRRWVLEGYKEFWGVKGYFEFLERKKYKIQNRVMLARYRAYIPCDECSGARLAEAGRMARVSGYRMHDLALMTIEQLGPVIRGLTLTQRERETVALPLRELLARLEYLNAIGLGYLTLNRQTRTLSGGETQRINLATALGSALTGTLYVLDEPTVGLHARDTERLLTVLQRLRDHGNTLVVVEHDPLIMRGADHIIDLGPAAGERGGELIYKGGVQGLLKCKKSLTGAYLRGQGSGVRGQGAGRGTRDSGLGTRNSGLGTRDSGPGTQDSQLTIYASRITKHESRITNPDSRIPNPEPRITNHESRTPSSESRTPNSWLKVWGARQNNLKNIDVAFPMGILCCLTGVSGSGKTSLLRDIVFAAYARQKGNIVTDVGLYGRIEGYDQLDAVLMIDQTPLGRSARSNPITYTKAYDEVRALFAEAAVMQGRRLTPSHFSFNVDKGRCPVCEGTGMVSVDMHFLADIEMTCEACEGRRFKPEVLTASYAGRSIVDVLEMTVEQATEFFAGHPKIVRALAPLRDVGLGYIRLGQRTSTLSGGEAQRLKLAGVLATRGLKQRSLLLFDEPTTGLHPSDIETLLKALNRLVEAGNSIIVIEHNLDFIARADYAIDLGPEGGEGGGRVVFAGPLPDLLDVEDSHTARCLRQYLEVF